MAINKLVSIHVPIIDAMDELGIDHDKDIPYFTRQAEKAERDIDSYYQYERAKKVLDMKDCIAHLPNDAVLVEMAIFGDHGECCDNLMDKYCNFGISNNVNNVNSNGLFLVVDVADDGNYSCCGALDYYIQNNKLIFNRKQCGQKITVQYLKFKTDCDGFIEVCDNHVEAIKWYIIWKYCIRQLNTNPGKGYMDRELLRTAEREWHRECAHARALDGEITEPERRQMVYTWHNPWSGKGLWQGMNTTLGNSFNIW